MPGESGISGGPDRRSGRPSTTSRPRRWLGLVPAGAALGAQWLLHVAAPAVPFAPSAFGQWVVEQAPGGGATAAIDTFGHWALRLLALGVVVGVLALAVALGRQAPGVLAVIAAVGTLLAVGISPGHPGAWTAWGSAAVAGMAALLAGWVVAPAPSRGADVVRRRLLAGATLGLGTAVLGSAAVVQRSKRSEVMAPVAGAHPVKVRTAPEFDAVRGLSSAVTPTEDHYTVDIDLENPYLDAAHWRLRVTGDVATPVALRLGDFARFPRLEQVVTMACISNPVGGNLVSTARWTGVRLVDVLDAVGPGPAADTVTFRSADGYTESLPMVTARRPEVVVAIGMNGRGLPHEHGHPARLLVPGRYGMKSVKWLEEISVRTGDRQGYWERRGWTEAAVIRTESRIDVPGGGQVRSPVLVAGVAWAGTRGISAVEVSPDGGRRWHPAELEPVLAALAWRRWKLALDLPSGDHTLTVRATDGTGTVQDRRRRPPHPTGASGWHQVRIVVEA